MQIALTQGIGHKGQLAVGQLCLGKLLGFQCRINAGGIILLTAAAVVPVVSAGAITMVTGILGAAFVIV